MRVTFYSQVGSRCARGRVLSVSSILRGEESRGGEGRKGEEGRGLCFNVNVNV